MVMKQEGRGKLRNEGSRQAEGREKGWEDKPEMKDAKMKDLRNE